MTMRASCCRYSVIWVVGLGLAASSVRAADVDGDGVPDGIDVCCNTPLGVTVDGQGRPLGDIDLDCDVDLADFAALQANLTGPMSCTPEVCDGLDNDCNCLVDDFPPLTCGIGACQVTVPACIGGVPQTCTPGNPQVEICNNLDDNCDGFVDEALGSTTCGTGICQNTVPNCIGGVPQNCTPNLPGAEVCNGLDDNCDGITDNVPNLPFDPLNCGACGNVCPVGPNATATCVNSLCGLMCAPGYGDCNVNSVDGCEVYLPSDPANCGSCNSVCPTPPNAASTCLNSQCVLVCNAGYMDCDALFGDGCEVHITSDTQNCGACGLVCPPRPNAVPVCSASQCSFQCNLTYANCNGNPNDGCEVHLTNDNQNCGTCGHVCGTGLACVNGICIAP